MKNFFEILSYYSLSMTQHLNSFLFSASSAPFEDSYTQILKKRYYANLTYVDWLAKKYGELGFFSVMSLYFFPVSLGVFGVITVNPVLIFSSFIITQFIIFIAAQHRALEKRFTQLVSDLENSEKQLNHAYAANLELESKLKLAIKKNDDILIELEEGRLEIKKIRKNVEEKEKFIKKTWEDIQDSERKTYQIVDKISEIKNETTQKGNECMKLVDEVGSIMKKTLEHVNSMADNPVEQKLTAQKAYLKELEDELKENYHYTFYSKYKEFFEMGMRNTFFIDQKSESISEMNDKNRFSVL